MTTMLNTTIKQPTGVKVYFQTPSRTTQKELKHTKHNLCHFYADTLDVEEAVQLVMEQLHETNEVFIMPILVKLQGGKA